TVVSLLLRASMTRGGTAPAARARLNAAMTTLELKLDVSRLDYQSYQATVRQLAGGVVWSGGNLKPSPGASGAGLRGGMPPGCRTQDGGVCSRAQRRDPLRGNHVRRGILLHGHPRIALYSSSLPPPACNLFHLFSHLHDGRKIFSP